MGFFFLSGAAAALPATVEAPSVQNYTVTLTAYNAVPAQTDDDPFTTASGAYSNPEVVAARSQDLAEELPFGTIIELDGPALVQKQHACGFHIVSPVIGYRIIADTMNARYAKRVDILFDVASNYRLADGRTKNASTVLGMCDGVTIRVVGHIDPTHPGKFPKTQAALAKLVNGSADIAVR